MSGQAADSAFLVLRRDGYEAHVNPIGAALCNLTQHGRDLIVPFDSESGLPAYGGALLAPWPNRVVNGRYPAGSLVEQQLALTEPSRGHALHGLLIDTLFEVTQRSDNAVTLSADVLPQQGYPWHLRVETRYEITPSGLRQTVRATNRSDSPAPYGVGTHPYLTAGDGSETDSDLDSWQLTLPASQVQLTEGERFMPGEIVSVSDDPSRFDFRTPRCIGPAVIDHALTGLALDAAGEIRVRLIAPSGRGVEMSWDTRCGWVQLCTADVAAPGRTRIGLAIEPMTCPPDAFNSGIALTMIEPGQSSEASWKITAI